LFDEAISTHSSEVVLGFSDGKYLLDGQKELEDLSRFALDRISRRCNEVLRFPCYLYADDFLLVCTLKWLIARWTFLPLLHFGQSAMRLSWSLMLM